ncbi:MAG: hypothetical protein ACQKBW_00310 [Puniceicoccales bacterium]
MSSSSPVSLFISRRVKLGHEADIQAWTKGIRAECAKWPGYLGSQTLERQGDDCDIFDVIVHFESTQALASWVDSDVCRQWYAKIEHLIEDQHMSRLQGFEPWFPPPASAGGPPPPRKWKMWIMSFLCVYPLVNLVLYLFGPLVGDMALWARLLISVPIVTFLMAFFVMPFLSRVFARWLYPSDFTSR